MKSTDLCLNRLNNPPILNTPKIPKKNQTHKPSQNALWMGLWIRWKTPVYKERRIPMEKYRYSKLTDDQHKKIMEQIEHLKTIEADPEAYNEAEYLIKFMWDLESMNFVCPNERTRYQSAIKEAMNERRVRQWKNSISTAV